MACTSSAYSVTLSSVSTVLLLLVLLFTTTTTATAAAAATTITNTTSTAVNAAGFLSKGSKANIIFLYLSQELFPVKHSML